MGLNHIVSVLWDLDNDVKKEFTIIRAPLNYADKANEDSMVVGKWNCTDKNIMLSLFIKELFKNVSYKLKKSVNINKYKCNVFFLSFNLFFSKIFIRVKIGICH